MHHRQPKCGLSQVSAKVEKKTSNKKKTEKRERNFAVASFAINCKSGFCQATT